MLKRMFVAPDPGRARLRFAARAVLGIGLAVVVCGLAGHSLAGAVTGGLAALLALFTVTDPTVRGQAVTTALLPVVGVPVLAAAAELHDVPVARDFAFPAVVGAGVYARRWGPRGHSLGVFAFMTFFVAQFLHATAARLPELYAAVLLSVLVAAAVFGIFYTAAVSYTWMMFCVVSTGRVAGVAGLGRVFADQARSSWRRLMCGCGHLRQSVGGLMLTLC